MISPSKKKKKKKNGVDLEFVQSMRSFLTFNVLSACKPLGHASKPVKPRS